MTATPATILVMMARALMYGFSTMGDTVSPFRGCGIAASSGQSSGSHARISAGPGARHTLRIFHQFPVFILIEKAI